VPPAALGAATLSVLVVDDNASVRHALQEAGRSFGWHTAAAAGAAQALALLQNAPPPAVPTTAAAGPRHAGHGRACAAQLPAGWRCRRC
jgi:CheY-like chemotaxis protein